MFGNKPKPAPIQAHSFWMKIGPTEFGAQGLGLIVALFAVALMLAALIVGGSSLGSFGVGAFRQMKEPTFERTADRDPTER